MRYALAIAAFKLCTRVGARFGGKGTLDRLQSRLLREVLLTMPDGSMLELPVNSILGPVLRLGKPLPNFN